MTRKDTMSKADMTDAERLLREALAALEPGVEPGPVHMATLEGRAAWLDRTKALRDDIRAHLASIESKESATGEGK